MFTVFFKLYDLMGSCEAPASAPLSAAPQAPAEAAKHDAGLTAPMRRVTAPAAAAASPAAIWPTTAEALAADAATATAAEADSRDATAAARQARYAAAAEA